MSKLQVSNVDKTTKANNKNDMRRIIHEMTERMTEHEVRVLIELADEKILLKIVKEVLEYLCGINKIK